MILALIVAAALFVLVAAAVGVSAVILAADADRWFRSFILDRNEWW